MARTISVIPANDPSYSQLIESITAHNPFLKSIQILSDSDASYDFSTSSYDSYDVTYNEIIELINLRSETLYFESLSSDPTAESLTYKNCVLHLILCQSSKQSLPNLGSAKMLPHTKVGHGAGHSASHSYSLAFDLREAPISSALEFALKTVFLKTTLRVCAYNTDLSPILDTAPVDPQIKYTSLNPHLDITPLQGESSDLVEFYEYLNLLFLNSSQLIPNHFDTYISNYVVPETTISSDEPLKSASSLTVAATTNVHALSARKLLSSPEVWKGVSIVTGQKQLLLFRALDNNLIYWECQ